MTAPGYVAVTDPGWWRHLRDRERATGERLDANFWKPSTRRFRLAEGTPFFFKLKAPHHAIAGFGYFAGFSKLPDWLAWETFGESNGVSTLEALRERLGAIRRGARIEAAPGGEIGCCLIAEATFFDEDDWVAPPRDWARTTQVGKTYALDEGEGARIWAECLGRGARSASPDRVADEPTRYGDPIEHRPRLGQSIFRIRVLKAYEWACAVTREHSLPALDAGHIRPFASGGVHRPSNGLALRADIHRLFDRGYVTVDAGGRFQVGQRLGDEFNNGRVYYELAGRQIAKPAELADQPDPDALAWHRERVFVG